MTKKKLIICLLFLLLGCKRIDNNDNYIEYVYNCLNNKNITNNVSLGYKYYLPRGIKKIHDYDYNQVFLTKETKFYLYVDVISYYHKNELIWVSCSEVDEPITHYTERRKSEREK